MIYLEQNYTFVYYQTNSLFKKGIECQSQQFINMSQQDDLKYQSCAIFALLNGVDTACNLYAIPKSKLMQIICTKKLGFMEKVSDLIINCVLKKGSEAASKEWGINKFHINTLTSNFSSLVSTKSVQTVFKKDCVHKATLTCEKDMEEVGFFPPPPRKMAKIFENKRKTTLYTNAHKLQCVHITKNHESLTQASKALNIPIVNLLRWRNKVKDELFQDFHCQMLYRGKKIGPPAMFFKQIDDKISQWIGQNTDGDVDSLILAKAVEIAKFTPNEPVITSEWLTSFKRAYSLQYRLFEQSPLFYVFYKYYIKSSCLLANSSFYIKQHQFNLLQQHLMHFNWVNQQSLHLHCLTIDNMEELSTILKTDPNTTSVNLEFTELESLTPLMPLLRQFRHLKELLLFGNRLEELPQDIDTLPNLTKLDISNNHFHSVVDLLPVLMKIPNLQDLHVTLQNEEDENLLLENLNLQLLNGVEMSQQMKESIDKAPSNLTQDDLEAVASLYDQVRSLWKAISPGYDQKLSSDFDNHVKSTIGDLSVLMSETNPKIIVQSYMLRAKHSLFQICQQKATNLVAKSFPKLSDLLANVNSQMKQIFQQMNDIVHQTHSKHKEKVWALKEDLKKAMKQTADVLEAAEQIQSQSAMHKNEQIKKNLQKELEELNLEMETLREQNKKYLDMIIKNSKQSADQSLSGKQVNYTSNTTKQYLNSSISKSLSLKQIKDVIEELYASKTKYDIKCKEIQQPRETMEQHMYTYLNQKYGLKSLVIEWAAAIIAAIKQFSPEDSDVQVLGKILKNECDEDFRFVVVQVKQTVLELIKMHLRAKHPLKSNADLASMILEKTSGILAEEEWVDVVKYMYNEEDANKLTSQLYELARSKKYKPSPVRGKMTREEMLKRERATKKKITYSDFMKVLLDFQIRGHEIFLKQFIEIFREADRDTNGIVDEKQFKQILESINGRLAEDSSRLLQLVDPYNHQQITFSECVALLSSVSFIQESMPGGDGDEAPVLQRLAMLY